MSIPDTVDVFLPTMVSHCYVAIVLSFSYMLLACLGNAEENVHQGRLEKLGVEKGPESNSTIPHSHAPHA